MDNFAYPLLMNNMRKVLITGANKGLGFELAKYLLVQGYFVYLGCRNTELGQIAIKTLRDGCLNNCELLEIDVSNQNSISEAGRRLARTTDVLDILINNAGILGRRQNPDDPLTIKDVRQVFETNLFGTIMVIEEFLPFLKKSTHAVIENITSDLASLTNHQDRNWLLYHAKSISYGPSKTALNAYTVALAYELREFNIKVNCVTPGWTSTDFNGKSGGNSAKENCVNLAKYAMIDENGPTGKFFGEHGGLPW